MLVYRHTAFEYGLIYKLASIYEQVGWSVSFGADIQVNHRTQAISISTNNPDFQRINYYLIKSMEAGGCCGC